MPKQYTVGAPVSVRDPHCSGLVPSKFGASNEFQWNSCHPAVLSNRPGYLKTFSKTLTTVKRLNRRFISQRAHYRSEKHGWTNRHTLQTPIPTITPDNDRDDSSDHRRRSPSIVVSSVKISVLLYFLLFFFFLFSGRIANSQSH